jgi:hypothetical protein
MDEHDPFILMPRNSPSRDIVVSQYLAIKCLTSNDLEKGSVAHAAEFPCTAVTVSYCTVFVQSSVGAVKFVSGVCNSIAVRRYAFFCIHASAFEKVGLLGEKAKMTSSPCDSAATPGA